MTDIVVLVQWSALLTAIVLLWAYVDTATRTALHRHRARRTTRSREELS